MSSIYLRFEFEFGCCKCEAPFHSIVLVYRKNKRFNNPSRGRTSRETSSNPRRSAIQWIARKTNWKLSRSKTVAVVEVEIFAEEERSVHKIWCDWTPYGITQNRKYAIKSSCGNAWHWLWPYQHVSHSSSQPSLSTNCTNKLDFRSNLLCIVPARQQKNLVSLKRIN